MFTGWSQLETNFRCTTELTPNHRTVEPLLHVCDVEHTPSGSPTTLGISNPREPIELAKSGRFGGVHRLAFAYLPYQTSRIY